MVVKIQRWWRSMMLLRGLDAEVALPPPVRMPKVSIIRNDSALHERFILRRQLKNA